jgi:nucleoside-diphosphate-sugar epimerase
VDVDVVTGAAGFIGSHLAAHLLERGEHVVGVDCLTDYYDPARKLQNVGGLLDHPAFRLEIADLASADLQPVLEGAARVFHLAGQPGVRPSWGRSFDEYLQRNVLATQALLEACAAAAVPRVVFASSSSVYGLAAQRPAHEGLVPQPLSPYGVTKLAAEHLCLVHRDAYGLSTAALRLFTLYDDGTQERDFTCVDDVVRALVAAGESPWTGVANIGGGAHVTMIEAIDLLCAQAGPIEVLRAPAQVGDVRSTFAAIDVARRAFGWEPTVGLAEGFERMVTWARQRQGVAA